MTETEAEQGQTQPMAMISAVAGVFSVLFAPCCILDPRLAAIIHGVLALIALTTGFVTTQRVAAGTVDNSNLLQARIGFVAGGIGLLIAAAWAVWIWRHPDGNPG